MTDVRVVQHVHTFENSDEDVKMIGVCADQASAQAAVQRLAIQSALRDQPAGFCTDVCVLGEDHWTEGHVTIYHGLNAEAQ